MPQGLPSVLLVEPEYRLRLQYKSIFRKAGFELSGEAGEPARALELAIEKKPGAVLFHLGTEPEGTESLARLAKLAPVLVLGKAAPELAWLGIYGCLPEGAEDEEILTSLAIASARWQEAKSLRQEAEELRDLLALRKILDQAKGILMKKHHMSEQEAHRRIQRYAMYKRLTVKSVAEAIIKATGGKA